MILSSGNKRAKYIVHFSYPKYFAGLPGVTVCRVKRLCDKRVVSSGVSQMSEKENRFVKAIGRKHALEKAIRFLDLPKFQRKYLWKSYFEQCSAE